LLGVPTGTTRPSVMVHCSAVECGSLYELAAWSLGTACLRRVSASVAMNTIHTGGMRGRKRAANPHEQLEIPAMSTSMFAPKLLPLLQEGSLKCGRLASRKRIKISHL
jgi:hypothetical protein